MVRGELVYLSLYTLLASNRSGIFLVYFPLYLIYVDGASVPVALAVVSVAYVVANVVGPVAGRWSDRVGRRKPFLIGAEVAAFPLFAVIPFTHSVLTAGVAFAAANVALAFGAPAVNAYVADVSAEGERGRGFGLLNATGYVGGIAGFLITGVIVETVGYPVIFAFVAAVMVGTIAVATLLVPDLPLPKSPRRRPFSEYRPLLLFAVAVSIRAFGSGAVGTYYGTYATQLGASSVGVAIVAIAGLAAGAFTAIPSGRYVDRHGPVRGIAWGTLLTLVSIGIFFLAPVWEYLIPGQAVRVIGFALLNPGMLVYVARLAPEGHRAEFLGVFALINATSWSAGPLMGGLAYSIAGAPGLLAFAFGTAAVSIVLVEGLFGRVGRAPPVAEPQGK
ncbi:MAG TPA: MFS transporter [Thermoplasmata archaeon]|nr:MFS transporter [Thermoplasmata archaeon]